MYSTVVDHEIKFPLYVNLKVIMTFIFIKSTFTSFLTGNAFWIDFSSA